MRVLLFLLLGAPALLWGQRYQLAPPRILVDSVFFRQKATVQLEFDLDSAVIRYSTDGTLPGADGPVYKGPFSITQSGVVWAQSGHRDFMFSTYTQKQLLQVSQVPDSVHLLTMPDSLYRSKGETALFDLQKGGRDLKSGQWLGFKSDTVVMELRFKQAVAQKRMVLSTLFDPGAWIFPPASIDIYGKNGDQDWILIGRWAARPDTPWKNMSPKYEYFQKVMLRPVAVERMKIRVVPFGPLPEDHPGAGHPAWLFLDEIVFQ